MKRMVVFILLLLLTCVWSNVCAGLYDNQSPIVVPSAKLTLCTPGTFLIGNYEFAFPKADITTNLQLEYFDMLHCYARQANLTLLPSSIITEPTYDTICAGETYTWHGNTYTKPGTYADTLSNIHGCDSIVTLHLHVLPDPPITFTVNGVSFKMMRVRAGTFMMGATADDTEAETNEHPAHQVTLTRDYFIAETMLTQELWTAVMGTTIQEEEAKGSGDKGLGYGPNYPMYCISYYECQDFVKSLSDSIGLEFRMPSEAEWEYAARGGHLSRGYKYPSSNDATEVAWNVARDPSKKLHEVKQLLPNELGLYDMAGNTWEWIYDFNRPYSGQPQIDPIGDTSSTNAFIRGGSSYYSDIYNRVSSRGIDFPKTYKRNRIAFRFVLDADHVIGEDNTTYQAYDTICAGETYTWNGNTYTTSGSYTDTLQNIYGCDSVVTLHLKVNQIQYAEEMVTVCNNYTWNGQTYTESGNYTYTTTAANGCDNITTLHLTINKTVYAEETVTACDSYTWNSETYTESGSYTYTTTAANGCDSITTLHLTINKTVYAEETVTACDSYDWNAQTYTESGNYTYTTIAANGCDSITTLHLTINKTVYAEETITACDSYTWNGQTYTESGNYTYTTTAANGCDSITTLHLTINKTVYAEETVTACDSYDWNAQTYTESGNYTYTTIAANGCDSITTLHLTINKTVYAEETITACDSYTWNGQTYTESGSYTYTTTAANGCDSITTLHLTINKTVYAEETVTACDRYDWNAQTYTESGNYTYTTIAANGCDSITTLHLTINKTVYAEETITACDSYTWNGQTYTESGSYTYTTTAANGCDSITTLHLTINKTVYAEETVTACDSYTWNSETYTESGNYTYTTTAANGCDSITTLHLTINYSDTALFTETACDSYTWHDQIYNTSGTYYYHTLTALGCDSVEVLHLTILPPTQYLAFDTLLCHGVICEWRDMLLTTAGTYNDTIKNQLLCDSIIYTLNLTYLPNVQNFTTDTTLCYGSTYEWRDMLLTTAGTYNNTVKNQLLCDSIIYTLHLHILPEIPITHITDTMAGAEYHWHEQIYTHGGEYTVILPAITGCDSVVILNLISNPAAIDTVILYEQCAGSGEQDLEILTQGFIEQIALSYSPAAQEAGLQDTIMPFSQDEIYTISYRDIRAGIHELTAIALFHNQQVATYSFALTYLYPNTIFEQRYNDLIAVLTHDYNGGYDFTDFQWYKDNIPLQGETHSYLNLPLSLTSQYSALLTNADGLQLMSCPVTIEDKAELSVSPTLIKAGTPVVCRVDLPMQLIIYHSSGIMMEEYELPEGKTNIFLPTVPGIYLLTFTSDMHIERHVKVIVQ